MHSSNQEEIREYVSPNRFYPISVRWGDEEKAEF